MRGIVRGLAISALATIIAGVVVWLIAKATGSVAIGRAFDDVEAPWIIAVAAAELLTYPAYTIAYRSLAQVHGQAPMTHAIAARIVVRAVRAPGRVWDRQAGARRRPRR